MCSYFSRADLAPPPLDPVLDRGKAIHGPRGGISAVNFSLQLKFTLLQQCRIEQRRRESYLIDPAPELPLPIMSLSSSTLNLKFMQRASANKPAIAPSPKHTPNRTSESHRPATASSPAAGSSSTPTRDRPSSSLTAQQQSSKSISSSSSTPLQSRSTAAPTTDSPSISISAALAAEEASKWFLPRSSSRGNGNGPVDGPSGSGSGSGPGSGRVKFESSYMAFLAPQASDDDDDDDEDEQYLSPAAAEAGFANGQISREELNRHLRRDPSAVPSERAPLLGSRQHSKTRHRRTRSGPPSGTASVTQATLMVSDLISHL